MIFYTLQGVFVGKRATPILQSGLNESVAWPEIRVHSANHRPLRYPDGPLDVWRTLSPSPDSRKNGRGRGGEGEGEELTNKKEVNMETVLWTVV